MLQAALEAEVAEYLQRPRSERGEAARGYWNGYLPERSLTLGSGSVVVKVPRVSNEPTRRAFSVKAGQALSEAFANPGGLFPKLFIKGLARRDFEPALRALPGAEAVNRLRAIQRASSRSAAEKLARLLIADWRKVFVEGAACLEMNLERLLNFYDFPSEHWRHLRTSNIIGSPFAAERLRTDAAKRFRTVKSGEHLIWQLLLKQEKNWLRFCGAEKCASVRLPE